MIFSSSNHADLFLSLRLIVTNCSGKKSFFSIFRIIKTEVKGRSVLGEVAQYKSWVHYSEIHKHTNFNEFLDNFL